MTACILCTKSHCANSAGSMLKSAPMMTGSPALAAAWPIFSKMPKLLSFKPMPVTKYALTASMAGCPGTCHLAMATRPGSISSLCSVCTWLRPSQSLVHIMAPPVVPSFFCVAMLLMLFHPNFPAMLLSSLSFVLSAWSSCRKSKCALLLPKISAIPPQLVTL